MIGDAFVSDALKQYRGGRDMVVVNTTYLHKLFGATGMPVETLREWQWQGDVRRAIFRLSQAHQESGGVSV